MSVHIGSSVMLDQGNHVRSMAETLVYLLVSCLRTIRHCLVSRCFGFVYILHWKMLIALLLEFVIEVRVLVNFVFGARGVHLTKASPCLS